MDAGKLAHWYRLQYALFPTVDIGANVVNIDAAGGYLTTQYRDAITGYGDGIVMSAVCVPDPGLNPHRSFSCVIPALSVNWTRLESNAGDGALEAYIEFENLRVYATNDYKLRIDFDNLRWYTGGTLRQSYGAGSISNAVLKPSGLPLLGALGPTLLAQVKADTAYIVTSTSEGDATVTMTGGWRFKENSGDAWQTLPVEIDVSSTDFPSATSCPCSAPTIGTLPTATNTYDAYLEASLHIDAGGTNPRYASLWDSQITLTPNVERAITRINPTGYGALWYRGGFPQCDRQGSWTCQPFDIDGNETTPSGGTTSSTLIDDEGELLSFVTNAAHSIEDPLAETVYAPFFCSAQKQRSEGGTMVGVQTRSCGYPVLSNGSPVLNWYQDTDDYEQYGNTWVNPLWSYLYYFYPEGDDDNDWKVDGTDPTRFYWLAIRHQWMHNTALPEAEDTHQRNFIVESPLLDGVFSDWIKDNLFGNAETHWVGVPRFNVIEPDVPASFTLTSASSPLWTDTDCALTFGSSITVTPDAGKTTVILELNIGAFGEEFEQALHQCDRVKPNWQTTNVSAVRVYAVSADGSTKVLLEQTPGDGYTTRNITYDIPAAKDTKYAGSHVQDNGAGLVTDTGTDLKAAGESSTVCADSERVHSFNLLGGGTFAKIRFEIDMTGNATLEYPVFYPSASDVTVIAENSHHHILLWPDGAGLRLGQWSWRDNTNIRTEPTVEVLGSPYVSGYRMTALDALCTRRVLFEGLASDDGLSTEIAALYDTVEGQTYTKADQFTNAFWLPVADTVGGKAGLSVLVNSFSAVPPLAVFPRRQRDADWAETGDYGQFTYSFCQLPRYLVSNKQTDLYDGSTKWTSPSSTTVAGFSIVEHSNAVDNTESGFLIVDASGNIAEVRPWHGWLFTVIGEELQGGTVAYAVSNSRRHAVANIVDGELWFGWTGNSPKPLTLTTADTGIAADWVAIRWTAKDELVFWTEEAGEIKQRIWNGSFGVSTTIATGKKPAACIAARGLRYIYWIDGTAIKGQIRDYQNSVVASTFTAIASGVDDNGIAADWSPSQAGGFSVILWYTASGSLTQAVSTDGQTFS